MTFSLVFMCCPMKKQVPFCFNPSQNEQVCGKEWKHANAGVSASYFSLWNIFNKMRPHQ